MGDPLPDNCPLLLDLPPEILLQIFSLIDIRTLYKVVVLTCKTFHELLTVDGIWKTLFALKWKEHDIINDLQYISKWSDVCFSYEDIDKYWKYRENHKIKLKSTRLSGHYASVDAVHIPNCGNICVSGSRDRSVLVWNLTKFLENEPDESTVPSVSVLNGHQGWIWAISSDKNKENEIITTSWDKSLKVWDINNETLLNTFEYHPAAILDLCCHDNVYTTCCFDKTVRTYDPRSESIVIQSTHHKRAVLSIQITDRFILSGSEDQTIGIYDVRGGKLFTSLRIDSPVLCMNIGVEQGFNYLRVGGKNGAFYIFDMTDDKFTMLDSVQLWEKYRVTKLCNYEGSLVACSQNGNVRMHTPDRNLTLLENFDAETCDVTSVHSRKNLLAVGRSDNTISLWNLMT